MFFGGKCNESAWKSDILFPDLNNFEHFHRIFSKKK